MRLSLCFIALACLTLATSPVGAQATPSVTAAARTPAPGACFRGRPLAECSWFWITEVGVAAPLSNNGEEIDRLPLFTWEIGGMKNVGARTALGATLLLEQSGLGYQRTGFAPRFRHWVGNDLPLDLSVGVTSSGWIGRAGLSFADYLGVSLQAEGHRDVYGKPTTTWYFGGRLGAAPGAAAGVAAMAFLIVGVALSAPGGD